MDAKSRGHLRELVETVLIAVVLALLARHFLVESFYVFGTSMEPTLVDAERLFVNKLSYRFVPPERGDIIVFRYPRNPERDFIKRVVAVGGEAVEIIDGRVLVSGRPLDVTHATLADNAYYPLTEVPQGMLFVLGDNRRNSEDSRFFGFVPLENVKGEAFLRFWPLHRLGIIH
ncbi:MAG TPA: signal peptidase I [Bacillota bacterium]|nr:signal peptidase I [Bacillota bacterium]